jgi:hypothetical protein
MMRRWWCAHWLLLLAAVDSIQTTTSLNAQKANHNHHHHHRLSRRRFALASAATALASLPWRPLPAFARAPGSRDVEASLAQLQEASAALLTLRREWADYTVIDKEGRAGDVDRARRILGGVNPQNLPNPSPLYKLDGAFRAVQDAAIDGAFQPLSELEVEEFAEVGERIVDAVRKADYQFYGCAFAPGGTKQIQGLYDQAGEFVDRAIDDFASISKLLADSKKENDGATAAAEATMTARARDDSAAVPEAPVEPPPAEESEPAPA